MTELEAKAKDCIENHTHKLVDKPTKQDIYLREESIFISGYKLGATETTEELRKENKELTLKVSRLESDCDAYNYSQRTYQEEIKELKAQIEEMKCCTEWQTGEPIKGREIFARNVANCNLLATYFSGAWRNVWNGAVIDFNKITMWRYTGFKNNGEEIDCKEIKEND